MSMPQIPPRPGARKEEAAAGASLGSDIPRIPPRPINRRADRSMSPSRESFARSPFNERPTTPLVAPPSASMYNSGSANNSNTFLPSIGQEGSEYGEAFGLPDMSTSPQTRSVANDLKLHAPKPAFPEAAAKARVSAVTRTDSGQAAAFGIGKANTDDKDPSSRPLNSRASRSSFASQKSSGGEFERPGSSLDGEHGIPEIGQRVPMYPNAGDVQAPSPANFASPYAPGIGFHNDGSKTRHHGRKASGHSVDVPPGSYGLHGHGVVPHDRFEKAYYEKHPELVKKETVSYHGPIGEGRAEWAMSSEDLNKIVRETASRGIGLGTSPLVTSTPSEQVGFQATEEYASRVSSPKPASAANTGDHVSHLSLSQAQTDSPRKNDGVQDKERFEKALSRGLAGPTDSGVESEEDNGIHDDRRVNKITGGAGHLASTENLGPSAEHGGIHDEFGYGTPILASDEVAKEPFVHELQPAVSPAYERTSMYDAPSSRPSSRPASIHGNMQAGRHDASAPLDDVEEYEPLFPEDEKVGKDGSQKPLTPADRVKNRPELKNRKFPSQDVWEDTPSSLQYTAEVSTPQLPEDNEDGPRQPKSRDEDTPERAFARRQEQLAEDEATDSDSFLNREKKPWANKPHLAAETRPSIKQRFPSRDVWEDTPDSLQLETTVNGPQTPEEITSPEEAQAPASIAAVTKPSIPARPLRNKRSESPEDSQPIDAERSKQAYPLDSTSLSATLKAKPDIPARPSRSAGSDGPAASKPKPPVPARPVGSKIAALQGGFMADLNSRLKLGPHAPKKEEEEAKLEETEKTPLQDARKGRARGPARRAPAKSTAPVAETAIASKSSAPSLSIVEPAILWQIDPAEEVLHVASHQDEPVSDATAAHSANPTLATNIAGEKVHEPAEITPGASKSVSSISTTEDPPAAELEQLAKNDLATKIGNDDYSPVKSSDEPPVVSISDNAEHSTLNPATTDETV